VLWLIAFAPPRPLTLSFVFHRDKRPIPGRIDNGGRRHAGQRASFVSPDQHRRRPGDLTGTQFTTGQASGRHAGQYLSTCLPAQAHRVDHRSQQRRDRGCEAIRQRARFDGRICPMVGPNSERRCFGSWDDVRLPPPLAARFTWGEIAVMRIVGDECRVHGCCTLHIDAIAGRAGVHRTTVQNALREAQGREPGRTAIITVQQRRRRGQRSLTNIIRIVSRAAYGLAIEGVQSRIRPRRVVLKSRTVPPPDPDRSPCRDAAHGPLLTPQPMEGLSPSEIVPSCPKSPSDV
jgi:hypothetical protein